MKLRLGQSVSATDGVFGVLGDIIVDPIKREVTHIVAEPANQHHQARLVPIWLLSDQDDALMVAVDLAHLRRLERVSFNDYVTSDQSVEVGDQWDIGTEDVRYIPFLEPDYGMFPGSDSVMVEYDRIPKGDCEIRRASEVFSGDEKHVGNVEGLTADDDDVTAVVVQCGMRGFRHNVLVPLGSVAKVRNDRIELSITEAEFDALPTSDIFGEPAGARTTLHHLQKKAANSASLVKAGVGRLRELATNRRNKADTNE